MTMTTGRSGRGSAAALPAVALFRSLADGTRLAILQRLAEGEARVADLVAELGLAQSTVSAHLACLRDCRLVQGRPQGRQVFYALSHPELMGLFVAAEALLEVTGEQVSLCHTYGPAGSGTVPGVETGWGRG